MLNIVDEAAKILQLLWAKVSQLSIGENYAKAELEMRNILQLDCKWFSFPLGKPWKGWIRNEEQIIDKTTMRFSYKL